MFKKRWLHSSFVEDPELQSIRGRNGSMVKFSGQLENVFISYLSLLEDVPFLVHFFFFFYFYGLHY